LSKEIERDWNRDMKYIRQLLLILLFSFIGEILHALIPLQIPASIYGLVLLFVALVAGWIKLSQVKETAKLLIEIMPMMFIPAGVGLMESWDELQPIMIPVVVIMVVSTVLVMGVSGRVTQAMIHRKKGGTNHA
jgi:holin-like protein